MIVKFYKTSNAPNEYPKTFTNELEKNCTLLEPTSTKTPTLKLEIDNNLKGYTHAVIFGDKYILRDDFTYDKGFMYIQCVRSALDTYWDIVKNCGAHITRCQNGDAYIIDDLATQRENDSITCIDLGNIYTSGHSYIWIKGTTRTVVE